MHGREPPLQRVAAPPPLNTQRHALFLDLDGTFLRLDRIACSIPERDAIRLLLKRLSVQMKGAIAVLTGHSVRDAERVLDGCAACVCGTHGAEYAIRGSPPRLAQRTLQVEAAALKVTQWIALGALEAHIENQGGAFELHLPPSPDGIARARKCIDAIARTYGLRVMRSDTVLKVVPEGLTKGGALSYLMHRPGFTARIPIVLCDTRRDDGAFAAAQKLGGVGVRIGRPAGRASDATLALPDLTSAIMWMANGMRAAA